MPVRRDDNELEKTSAFQYGLCAFEGILCWKLGRQPPRFFRIDSHLKRLHRSLAYLGLYLKENDIQEKITKAIASLKGFAYMRLLCYSSAQFKDIRLIRRRAIVTTFAHRIRKRIYFQGMRRSSQGIVLENPRLNWGRRLAEAKISGKYLIYLGAQEQARTIGKNDALLLDTEERIVEAATANILFVRGRELVVPVSPDRFPGVTQDTIITLAKDSGIRVTEEEIRVVDLAEIDGAFLTGTARGVVPLSSISYENKTFHLKENKIQALLRNRYIRILNGKDETYERWLTPFTSQK